MIDYGVLPPEINSGRMYTGAGAGPMLAAATAWDVLADEWSLTAAAFETTVTDLTVGPWRGPSALAMAAAALPFTVWLKATAAQAEHAASQAKAAVAAYETAFAMTVPPAVVAANRAQLLLLVATNFFGQNTAAIAATEAHYAEMWAQDAVAMYGYAGSSHAAAQVSPFTSPPQATNPAGLGGQAAATGQGAGTAPGTSAMFPSAPQALAQLGGSAGTAPTAPGAPAAVLPGVQKFVDQWSLVNRYLGSGFSPAAMSPLSQTFVIGDTFPKAFSGAKEFLAEGAKLAEGAAKSVGTASAVAPGVSAGTAAKIGALSVPSSWPGAVPAANSVTPAAATLVASRAAAGLAAEAGAMSRGGFGLPFLPGAAAAAGGGAHGFRFVPRYGYRHRVMTRPPHAG